MANNLRSTIEEILKPNITLHSINVRTGWGSKVEKAIRVDIAEKATDAIISTILESLKEIGTTSSDIYKITGGIPPTENAKGFIKGYNQCRLDILKELGGGNE